MTTSPVVPTKSCSSRAARKASASKSKSSTLRATIGVAAGVAAVALGAAWPRPWRPESGPSKSAMVSPSRPPMSKSSSSLRLGLLAGTGRPGAAIGTGAGAGAAPGACRAEVGSGAAGRGSSFLSISTWGGFRGPVAGSGRGALGGTGRAEGAGCWLPVPAISTSLWEPHTVGISSKGHGASASPRRDALAQG